MKKLSSAPNDTNKVLLFWKVGASIVYQNALQSIPYFKQGLELAKKLRFDAGIERCYAGTSLAYSFNAKYDTSLLYIDSAIPAAIKVGNTRRLGLVYLNRADIYQNLQNLREAIKNCDTALRYAEQAKNKDGIGRVYSVMSDVYNSQKKYDQALLSLDKASVYFKEVKNIQMVAMNMGDKADILVLQGKYKEAVPLYERSMEMADSLEDHGNMSAYFQGLANAYISLGQYAKAKTLSVKGLKFAEESGNRKQVAMSYELMSFLNFEQKNYQTAIEYGLKSYAILQEEKDLLREQINASKLAEAYFAIGNTTEAYKFLKRSRDLNDSLIAQQYNTETANLQTAFRVAEKDKEIQLLNKDKELQQQRLQKQSLLMIGAAIFILVAFTGIWLVMSRNKLKQRMKELELRNQIAADLHDEVGSSLSSIHMLSQMASGATNNHDLLARMSSNAKETMDKMSDIVWMIKPGAGSNEVEASSLKQRMERFAQEICSSRNIELYLQLDELEQAKLTMNERKNIYLIFKEALNNAVKYSGSPGIAVVTYYRNKELTLEVKDEGRGFDGNSVKKGNGLDNIRMRASELGGQLLLEAEPGKGTTVRLSVMLNS
ncbi:MAG: tetratricopeptide repeat protein [Chitinophagaceae bacterium]|nr:tetratricopeptide repeat protein [Chitinophagaceae bacterium]